MRLPLLPKGVYQTKAGHLRYSSPRDLRDKYVHRKTVEDLIKETPYSIQLLLPWPYEVHHMNYDKTDNAPSNLLMISEAMHSSMTADRGRSGSGRFKPKWSAPPLWLPLFDCDEEDEEVPF
jgi:hypothetical protein